MTSDLLDMDHIDHHFDCHEIHNYEMIDDKSLDIIVMTNVLHHLAEPLKFLTNAASKLRQGGWIIMTEPYFSTLSRFIFTYLHHEPSDFSINNPRLQRVRGPLSSANMAVPYMIFFMRKDWREALNDYYDFNERSISFFSSLSYMATGGISRKLPIPNLLYKRFLYIDLYLARKFPWFFCSFFTVKLRKK
jgi:SAM-dependent methyltransferase